MSGPPVKTMGTRRRDVLQVSDAPGGFQGRTRADTLAVEEPLEIRLNAEPLAVTMRTPGHDSRLAVGFLFAEGVIKSIDDVGSVAHCGRPGEEGFGNVIDVIAAPGAQLAFERVQTTRRGTLTTSACGVCGRTTIDDLLASCRPLQSTLLIEAAGVAQSAKALEAVQKNFALTGGVHAAAALDAQGRVLAGFEDVGRHNAVDKVVGALVYQRQLDSTEAAMLVVSGRASFEIIQKAARARIPVVACVSAPSSLAVELADRIGITLAAFVRGNRFNLYTHPHRVSGIVGAKESPAED